MNLHRHRDVSGAAPEGAALRCPSCRAGSFTRQDMLWANLDGSTQCGACGETARLDIFGRWVLSCFLAMVLPTVLIYGNVFYSGHLFVVSIAIIFGVWRGLAFLCLPFLTLEAAPGGSAFDRGANRLALTVLLIGAVAVDALIASRFETPDPLQPQFRQEQQR